MSRPTTAELAGQDKKLGNIFWGLQIFIGGGTILTGSWWLFLLDGIVIGGVAYKASRDRQKFNNDFVAECDDCGTHTSEIQLCGNCNEYVCDECVAYHECEDYENV